MYQCWTHMSMLPMILWPNPPPYTLSPEPSQTYLTSPCKWLSARGFMGSKCYEMEWDRTLLHYRQNSNVVGSNLLKAYLEFIIKGQTTHSSGYINHVILCLDLQANLFLTRFTSGLVSPSILVCLLFFLLWRGEGLPGLDNLTALNPQRFSENAHQSLWRWTLGSGLTIYKLRINSLAVFSEGKNMFFPSIDSERARRGG